MQNNLPKLRTLQVLTREEHENKRENAVIKREYEKWLPPQALVKAMVTHFTVEVLLTCPLIDMNLASMNAS